MLARQKAISVRNGGIERFNIHSEDIIVVARETK